MPDQPKSQWPRDLIVDGRLVAIVYNQETWDELTRRLPAPQDKPGHFRGIPVVPVQYDPGYHGSQSMGMP